MNFCGNLDKLLNDGAGNVYITFKAQGVRAKDIPDGELEIKVQTKRTRRSLSANAYFHVLIGKIAKALNAGDDEMKTRMVLEYGTAATENDENIIVALPKSVKVETYYPYAKWIGDFAAKNGKPYSQYLLYKQTHTLDKTEMAQLIDGVVSEAKQLGIETITPAEKALMLERWKGAGYE